MRTHSDVVIIGGGAVGSSIAYRLASEGSSVTLLERDSIAGHASGFSGGLLNPTSETGKLVPLHHQSFRMHREMLDRVQQESGVDAQVLMMPHIELALTEADIPIQKAELERISKFSDFKSEWLEPGDIRKLEPRITEDLYGGVLVEDVIILDSYNFTLATARAAEAHGAEIVLREATRIIYEKDRAVGVMLGQDRISCGAVVLALGPWSGAATLWVDIDVPVAPQKGELVRLEGLDPRLGFHLRAFHSDNTCAVYQKADGLIWLGATRKDGSGFDTTPSADALDSISLTAMRMMPELESQKLVLQTACLRPVTPDGDPILGQVPGKEGMFIATGTAGQGILLAPVIGRAIADLVSTGETDIDIAPFGFDRFSQGR
ncbi:MAG: FAD-binding oxidoreductase [Chloroflexi bacterium]|nr:FAD-binding oxidoreductase [Chloroflexota bacterium]MCH8911081.1 FAD-binding oxidoreductase [Chloroflexota bacterium]